MENKSKKNTENITPEPIVIKTNVKKIVAKKKSKKPDTKSIEEHMQENIKTSKFKINWLEVGIFFILLTLIGGAIFLILYFGGFITEEGISFEKTTFTTTERTYETTTTSKPKVEYIPTTPVPTQATHHVFPGN